MPELYVPKYLLQGDEQKADPVQKPDYTKCKECGEYWLTKEMDSHRKTWCDPEHKRKKQMMTRSSIAASRLTGGYILETGVSIRPIDNPPQQILRGKCRDCRAVLALPEDFRCMACGLLGGR